MFLPPPCGEVEKCDGIFRVGVSSIRRPHPKRVPRFDLPTRGRLKNNRSPAMNVVCHIRYEIDPFMRAQFETYAKAWLTLIPACGGALIGYFLPYEGTNYEAHAMIGFPSLAAYENYRACLRDDPKCRANFEFAQRERFILKEDRAFLQQVTQ
jgi:hypothetical protein